MSLHLLSLFRADCQPTLGPEEVCVITEQLLVSHEGELIPRDFCPARDVMAQYAIALGRSALDHEDLGGRVDTHAFIHDGLESVLVSSDHCTDPAFGQ